MIGPTIFGLGFGELLSSKSSDSSGRSKQKSFDWELTDQLGSRLQQLLNPSISNRRSTVPGIHDLNLPSFYRKPHIFFLHESGGSLITDIPLLATEIPSPDLYGTTSLLISCRRLILVDCYFPASCLVLLCASYLLQRARAGGIELLIRLYLILPHRRDSIQIP